MKIHIQQNNIQLTPEQTDYIHKKLEELDHFIPHPDSELEAWVTIGRPSLHHEHGEVFETTIDFHVPGRTLRAENQGPDLYSTITQVKDELQQEIKKYKGKMQSKRLKGFRWFKNLKNRE